MTELSTLFIDPIALGGWQRALMLLPICLSVSVVYKTLKLPDVRQIPLAALGLWLTIVFGLWMVALTMWLLYRIFA